MVVRVFALLLCELGKLGLQFAHLLLERNDVGAVDPPALGAVVVLARRT
jgi:hypothetical protein